MRHRVSGDRRGGEPTPGESYDNHPSVGSTAPADAAHPVAYDRPLAPAPVPLGPL